MINKLFFLSLLLMSSFAVLSYSVAKEAWQQLDFDTTVRLQDNISRQFDGVFSYFSLLGSAEVTVGLCAAFAALALYKRRYLSVFGWLMVIPATTVEVVGKLVIFHPGPPAFFLRSLLPTSLPSFYVHTDFSYPSGHMTRSIFIVSVFLCILGFSTKSLFLKIITSSILLLLALLMGLTRIYLGEHWLSDVLGGYLLGASAGTFAALLILNKSFGRKFWLFNK